MARLLADYPTNFWVEDHAAVTEIDADSSSTYKYQVKTRRGTICARHVVHSTNAHISHLVPGLRGRIFPVRGQMSAQTPGDRFPCQGNKFSWLFNYDRGFDYLTQLPEGPMMFGGGLARSDGSGVAELGVSTDCDLSLYIEIHLSGALSALFGRQSWGHVQGNPIQAMWTGSMGFSTDGFPWVGLLPESATHRRLAGSDGHGAEWVCAAFGGEGMVQAWLCGKALATMLLSHDKQLAPTADSDVSWLPDQMLVSEARIMGSVMPHSVVNARRQANL